MIEKTKKNYVYILIFVTFLLINYFVPTGGDDWEISSWYNSEGLFGLFCKSIGSWQNFNGRIIHNFFTMFLSKYDILWMIISAGIYTITIYVLLKIFNLEKNKKAQFLLFLFFFMVSSGFRMEVQLHKNANTPYSWSALISFFIIMLFTSDKVKNKISAIRKVLFILLGIFCSLWIENITIAILSTSILLLAISYIKTKKINQTYLYITLGCIIGSVILFSSPGFFNRYNNTTGNLSTTQIVIQNLPVILNSITLEMKTVYLLLSIISLFVFIVNKEKIFYKLYYLCISVVLSACIILENLSRNTIYFQNEYMHLKNTILNYNGIIGIIFMVLLLLSVLIVIFKLFNKENKTKAFLLVFLSFMSVAPMVMSPGNRNYIIYFYSLFVIITYTFSLLDKVKMSAEARKVIDGLIIILFVFRIESYHYILNSAYKVTKMRNNIISEYKINRLSDKMSSKYLILPMYEKEILLNLSDEYYSNSIINYYDLNKDTIVVFNDHFMYRNIETNCKKEKCTVTINTLSNEIILYNVKIYDESNKNVFSIETKKSSFDVNLLSGKYTIDIEMYNTRNSTLNKKENLIIE